MLYVDASSNMLAATEKTRSYRLHDRKKKEQCSCDGLRRIIGTVRRRDAALAIKPSSTPRLQGQGRGLARYDLKIDGL